MPLPPTEDQTRRRRCSVKGVCEGSPGAVQVLELPNRNDKVVDFRWEPRGSRFAVLHGEGPKPDLSVYAMKDMRTSTKGVQHIGSQPGKQANCIHWSPQVQRPPLHMLLTSARCSAWSAPVAAPVPSITTS